MAKKRQEFESAKNPPKIEEGRWMFFRPGLRFMTENGLVLVLVDRGGTPPQSHVEVFTPEECDYFANTLDQHAAVARKNPTPAPARNEMARVMAYELPADDDPVPAAPPQAVPPSRDIF